MKLKKQVDLAGVIDTATPDPKQQQQDRFQRDARASKPYAKHSQESSFYV